MPSPSNRCPACGPVEPHLSSRYCGWHIQELTAACLAGRVSVRSPATLLVQARARPDGADAAPWHWPPERPHAPP